ncbi:MAG: hypothetical protein ACRET5_17220 [Steroidobacteraceae bacterium]
MLRALSRIAGLLGHREKLLESGRPLRLAHGITGTRQAGHAVVVTLASGRYALSAPET